MSAPQNLRNRRQCTTLKKSGEATDRGADATVQNEDARDRERGDVYNYKYKVHEIMAIVVIIMIQDTLS